MKPELLNSTTLDQKSQRALTTVLTTTSSNYYSPFSYPTILTMSGIYWDCCCCATSNDGDLEECQTCGHCPGMEGCCEWRW